MKQVKNKINSVFLVLGILFLFARCGVFVNSQPLTVGSKAPLFTAQASLDGKPFQFSLKEALVSGPVVVYFYPSAYTKGCDLEAHTFSKMKDQFTKAGTTIIGISADNIERLNDFSADPDYCAGKFPVASDPQGEIAKKYGLNMRKIPVSINDVRGKEINHGFLPRVTFVIDSSENIIAVFSSKKDDISPDQHVKKALKIVQKLEK